MVHKHFKCFTRFYFKNRVSSSAMNWGPLSVTTCLVNQYAAKSLSVVLLAVTIGISIIAGHLEWASTINTNIF